MYTNMCAGKADTRMRNKVNMQVRALLPRVIGDLGTGFTLSKRAQTCYKDTQPCTGTEESST